MAPTLANLEDGFKPPMGYNLEVETPKGATIRNFAPDQPLFNEADPSHSLFVIRKGVVSIRKRKIGAPVEIARVFSGEVVGEMGFFDHKPRSAQCIALTEVEVIEIEYEAMEGIYNAIPSYMRTIMAGMAERLRKVDDELRRLKRRAAGATDEEEPEPDSASGEGSGT